MGKLDNAATNSGAAPRRGTAANAPKIMASRQQGGGTRSSGSVSGQPGAMQRIGAGERGGDEESGARVPNRHQPADRRSQDEMSPNAAPISPNTAPRFSGTVTSASTALAGP